MAGRLLKSYCCPAEEDAEFLNAPWEYWDSIGRSLWLFDGAMYASGDIVYSARLMSPMNFFCFCLNPFESPLIAVDLVLCSGSFLSTVLNISALCSGLSHRTLDLPSSS